MSKAGKPTDSGSAGTQSAPVYRRCVEIVASPEDIWHALTDTVQCASWYYGTGIESTFRPGEEFRYAFPDGTTAIRGTIVRADKPRHLEMLFHPLWNEEVAADKPTRVTWSVDNGGGKGNVSLVCVEQEGLVPGSATEKEVTSGWPDLLQRLKEHLEVPADT